MSSRLGLSDNVWSNAAGIVTHTNPAKEACQARWCDGEPDKAYEYAGLDFCGGHLAESAVWNHVGTQRR